MKKIVLSILIVFGSMIWTGTTLAQSGEGMQKLQAAKIGLITERLGLTPDQAEKFWPIYKEYGQKRRAIQTNLAEMRKGYDRNTATEEETRRLIKESQEIKQQKLNLEKEYSEKMLDVIDTRQLMSLKQAESDFREQIIKRLEQRRNQQQQREDLRQRNLQRMKEKRN